MTTKPQDHKQPKDKPRRIEVMGATLTIDPSILDDLQHAADSDDGGFTIVPFLRKLCGDDYANVKKALRDDNGRIPFEKVGEFVQQLIEALNPNS